MFTSIINRIIGTKFQINLLTVTLFSGSEPKSPTGRFWCLCFTDMFIKHSGLPYVIGSILSKTGDFVLGGVNFEH